MPLTAGNLNNTNELIMKKTLILTVTISALLAAPILNAQDAVRETTTVVSQPVEAVGTITEFAGDAIVIRTKEGAEPVRYGFTKTTEYVDEAGNRITRDVVKSGTPVTVRYVKEGDRMVVSRVIVRKQTTTTETGPASTTTTTTVKPIETIGTVTAFDPDAIMIRTKETAEPVRYSYSKTTEYVDEAGNRVERELVKSGVPVTIRYVKDGDRMLVSRVIVRKQITTDEPEAVVKKKTTTTTVTEGKGKEKDKD